MTEEKEQEKRWEPISKNIVFTSTQQFAPIQHLHTGTDTPKIKISDLRDNYNLFSATSTIPTAEPQNCWQRIKIYSSGGTSRLYWWDTTLGAWKYTTGL